MSSRAWVAFAAVSLLWGIPYLFIKIAVDGGMPPFLLAWGRLALAAAVLLAIAWRAGTLAPLRGRGRWLLAYAVAELAVPFPMLGVGEERVASSTAAIVIATAPLLVAVLALRFEPGDRVDRRRLVGLLLGLGGVAALVGIDVAGSTEELLGVACVFVAACGYAIGPMVLKRHLADLDPIASMGVSIAIAGLLLTPLAALSLPAANPSGGAFASVAFLGLIGTALGLVLMAVLVDEAGPGRALVIAYINPVVAVALGVIFLSEEPGVGAIFGLGAILAGSWLATRGEPPAEIEPDAAAIRGPAAEPPPPG
ncbi:MAG TPA: DMT family transporter [Solirubrobacterales bacterium]|nr:DMT family transporter [Solirubrobacterales bacterium]